MGRCSRLLQPDGMRKRYTVVIDHDGQWWAVGNFYSYEHAVQFGQMQQAAGRGVVQGIAAAVSGPMFGIELSARRVSR